jgi:hypothetical protein
MHYFGRWPPGLTKTIGPRPSRASCPPKSYVPTERDTERDLTAPQTDAEKPAPLVAAANGRATPPSAESAFRTSGRFDTEIRKLAEIGAALHDGKQMAEATAANPALIAHVEKLTRENPEGSGPFRQRIGPDLLPDAPPSERAESIMIAADAARPGADLLHQRPRVEIAPTAATTSGRDDVTAVIPREPPLRERVPTTFIAMLGVAAIATLAIAWLVTRSPGPAPSTQHSSPPGQVSVAAPIPPQAPPASAQAAPREEQPSARPPSPAAAAPSPSAAAPRASAPAPAPASPKPRAPTSAAGSSVPPAAAPTGPRVWFP